MLPECAVVQEDSGSWCLHWCQFVSGAGFDSKPSGDSYSRASVRITEQPQSMQTGVFLGGNKSGNVLQSCVSCTPAFNGDSNDKTSLDLQ